VLGILLVDKPAGCTSHDVVDAVRRKLKTRRVGHAGTLDPLATGILVVAVGPATRFLQYLPLEPKVYLAEVTFGVVTTTMDGEGEVVSTAEPPTDLETQLRNVLPTFGGLIEQMPPMYSAIKKDGKPLYAYARAGQEVERKARTVHLESIDVLSVDSPKVALRVTCSGGTYVRSLANDIGEAVGCGAHLSALRREAVGRFRLEESMSLDDVAVEKLMPLKDALPPMPLVYLDVDQTQRIREGRQVDVEVEVRAGLVGLVGPNDAVVGIARAMDHTLQPECVIPAEAVDA
jgi:tRNA pseudouridine55 synthase